MSPEDVLRAIALAAPVLIFGALALGVGRRPDADLEGMYGGAAVLIVCYFILYITGWAIGG